MSKDDRDGRKGGAHKSAPSLYHCRCHYCEGGKNSNRGKRRQGKAESQIALNEHKRSWWLD